MSRTRSSEPSGIITASVSPSTAYRTTAAIVSGLPATGSTREAEALQAPVSRRVASSPPAHKE